MTMNPTPRKLNVEDQKLIDEYLNNGGTVTKKPAYQRTEDISYTGGFYGKPKPKSKEVVQDDGDDD